MVEYYLQIKFVHVLCVFLSGALFATRGMLRLAGSSLAHHAAARWASYAIDTTLLTAALMLIGIVHQYPFANGWLTTKVLLLVVYIVLGAYALRRARSRRAAAVAFLAALTVFATIIGAAVLHDARSWLALIAA
jgi:uncharacterized membrane protein SirB2